MATAETGNFGADIGRLVSLARTGEPGAADELLRRATPLVYARVLRSLHGAGTADDVAQDVLLSALAGLAGLRKPSAFLSWLRRITDNTVADHLARQRREPTSYADMSDRPDRPTEEAGEALAQREDRRRVRAAVAALAPRSRLVIELFYFHGLSCREVAGFLAVSHDAARAVLSRARKKLRRRMMTQTPEVRQKHEEYWTMFVSGESTFRGGLFDRGSKTDWLYRALYPSGDKQAAEATDLSPAEIAEQLGLLQEMGLIVPQGDRWRCTMPLVSEIDCELIRPWAAPIAEIVIGRLDEIHERLTTLCEGVAGQQARSTVMTIGLLEAARQPFAQLDGQMKATDSMPQRGRFGSFRIAIFLSERPAARAFIGGYGSEKVRRNGCTAYASYFWPHDVRRVDIEVLNKAFPQKEGDVEISHRILSKLALLADGVVTGEAAARIPDKLGVPEARRDEFWSRLVELHAVAEHQGSLRVIVPRVDRRAWEAYLSRLRTIGTEIESTIVDAAGELRKRALHCSFADCNFADSVLAFLMYLEMYQSYCLHCNRFYHVSGRAFGFRSSAA